MGGENEAGEQPDPAAAALKLATALGETLKAVSKELDGISAYGRRSRRVIWTVAVSVAVDLTLSAVVLFLAVSQAHVSTAIHDAQLSGCVRGNEFRAGQVQLWDHVFAISGAPPAESAAQRAARLKKITEFRAFVLRHNTPVNCARLYGK